jgi:hypothetical protein
MICQNVSNTLLHLPPIPSFFELIPFPAAFYMVGDIESARAKGEKILADLEKSS